jgi:chromosome segregation ATPase
VHKFGADIEVLMSRPQDVISVDLKKYEKADPKFLDLVSHLQRANADLKTAQHALDLVRAEINEIEKQKKELEEEAHKDGVKAGIAQTKLNLLISSDHSKLNEATLHAEAMVRKVKPAAEIARKAWAEYTDAHPDVKKDLSEIRDQGAVWWIEREMVEFKKYRPRAN